MMATPQVFQRRQTRSSVRLRDHEAEFQKDLEAALEISRVTYDREKDLRQRSDEPTNAEPEGKLVSLNSLLAIQKGKRISRFRRMDLSGAVDEQNEVLISEPSSNVDGERKLVEDNGRVDGDSEGSVQEASVNTEDSSATKDNERHVKPVKGKKPASVKNQSRAGTVTKPTSRSTLENSRSNVTVPQPFALATDKRASPGGIRLAASESVKQRSNQTRSGFTEALAKDKISQQGNEHNGDGDTLVHQPINVGSLPPPRRSKKRKKKDFVRTHFGFDEPAECKQSSPEGQARSVEEDIYLLVDDEDDVRQVPDGEIVADDCLNEQSTSGNKIAYPSSDDPDAVELDEGVLQCLKEMEYLNDTVIDFYIKYMQVSTDSVSQGQFHVFNSFFYKKLARAVCAERSLESTDEMCKLRKWIKGINIFEKSYLIMPIHDKQHWSLAIVCFLRSGSYEPCFILHLDSMKTGHNSRVVFEVLRRYLLAEWRSHSSTGDAGAGLKAASKNIRVKKVKVPQQDNEYDCGLYLLHFIERFLAKAPSRFDLSLVKDMFDWFQPNEASELRVVIRHLIQGIFEAVNENGGVTLRKKIEEPGESQEINQESADIQGCKEIEGGDQGCTGIQDTSKECEEINEKSAGTQDLDGGDLEYEECKEIEDGSTGSKDWRMIKGDHEHTRSKKSKGRLKCFERRRYKQDKGEV